MAGATALFTLGVLAARYVFARWLTPLLAGLRSVELVVLFAVVVLGLACLGAERLGLPLAIGALAAGLALSGQRLSRQIDAVLLPFREVFAAVFFVSLGMLMRPAMLLEEPLLLILGTAAVVVVKGLAGAAALRVVGLPPKAALGMGIGLAQLGEFSFLLMNEASNAGVIAKADYARFLAVALGTLLATPWLLGVGLKWSSEAEPRATAAGDRAIAEPLPHAVVIGVGPIGRQVASRLETEGVEVALVDLSPVNLYAFEQAGFHTVQGNARDPGVLQRAGVERAGLVAISVPDDAAALEIVRRVRGMAPKAAVAVRCRFEANAGPLGRAGADEVVSEESEAAGRLLEFCERRLGVFAAKS
jgi:CPA2 family monovalent cation:H+ antiporter-2